MGGRPTKSHKWHPNAARCAALPRSNTRQPCVACPLPAPPPSPAEAQGGVSPVKVPQSALPPEFVAFLRQQGFQWKVCSVDEAQRRLQEMAKAANLPEPQLSECVQVQLRVFDLEIVARQLDDEMVLLAWRSHLAYAMTLLRLLRERAMAMRKGTFHQSEVGMHFWSEPETVPSPQETINFCQIITEQHSREERSPPECPADCGENLSSFWFSPSTPRATRAPNPALPAGVAAGG